LYVLYNYVYLYIDIKTIIIMAKPTKDGLQLTSVKVDPQLFSEFKIQCVQTKFTLQKLTDRALHLYVTNNDFKNQIHGYIETEFTGSI